MYVIVLYRCIQYIQINNCMTRVFITTPSAKAGSTLFAWLLAQHSYIEQQKIPEEDVFGQMLNILDWAPAHDANKLIHRFTPSYGTDRNISHIQQFYDNLVNPCKFKFSSVKFVGFHSYKWLQTVFPKDAIIVIIRNPLDWYISWREWPNKFKWTEHNASVSRWFNDVILPATRSLDGAKHVMIVPFEDLINSPQQTMNKVYEYLGWPCEDINLYGHQTIYNEFTSLPQLTCGNDNKLINKVIGRGEKLLSDDDKNDIAAFIKMHGTASRLWKK